MVHLTSLYIFWQLPVNLFQVCVYVIISVTILIYPIYCVKYQSSALSVLVATSVLVILCSDVENLLRIKLKPRATIHVIGVSVILTK